MHLQYPSLWLTNIAHLGVDHQSANHGLWFDVAPRQAVKRMQKLVPSAENGYSICGI